MWARVATFEGVDVERMRAEANRPPDRLPEGLRGAFVLMVSTILVLLGVSVAVVMAARARVRSKVPGP